MATYIYKNAQKTKDFLGAKVGRVYPKNCNDSLSVCNPVATSFGDECGFEGCDKIT